MNYIVHVKFLLLSNKLYIRDLNLFKLLEI